MKFQLPALAVLVLTLWCIANAGSMQGKTYLLADTGYRVTTHQVHVHARSKIDCIRTCRQFSNCTSFVFEKSSGDCYLNPNITSGGDRSVHLYADAGNIVNFSVQMTPELFLKTEFCRCNNLGERNSELYFQCFRTWPFIIRRCCSPTFKNTFPVVIIRKRTFYLQIPKYFFKICFHKSKSQAAALKCRLRKQRKNKKATKTQMVISSIAPKWKQF